MKRAIAFLGVAALVWMPTTALAQWSDNFDSYDAGTKMTDIGGWDGWYDDGSAAGTISDAMSLSSPNSMEVSNSAGVDAVHPFAGYDSGTWTLTAWQYVPSDLDALTYFIINNEYDHVGAYADWAIETHMDPATGLVNEAIRDSGGAGALPLIYDEWVEITTVIDLDNNYMHHYYGGDLLAEGQWNIRTGGLIEIQNLDLYAPHNTGVFYDDISLVPEPTSCLMLLLGASFVLRRR
jgi:hypothetical protein